MGQSLLQIGASLFYYKFGQVLLQIGEAQLLQIRAAFTNKGNRYYKLGKTLLEIRAAVKNWGIPTSSSSITSAFMGTKSKLAVGQ